MKNRNTFKFLFAAALIGGSFAASAMEEQFKRLKIDSDQEKLGEKLIKAARRGDLEQIRTLLQDGANVDCKDSDGWTALMEAAYAGNHDIVTLLINAKAKLNIQDKNDNTALIYAARSTARGSTKCARLLIAANADVFIQNKLMNDALLEAYEAANIKTMYLLVDANADLRPLVKRYASWNLKTVIQRGINAAKNQKNGTYPLLWCLDKWTRNNGINTDFAAALAESFLEAQYTHKQMLRQMLREAIKLLPNETTKSELKWALYAEPDNDQSN